MVEMQMAQQSNFIQRTLYNASKVYARQLPKNNHYKDLQPVYSINLLNHSLDNVTESWHHWYRLTHHEHFDMQLDDLNLIFFELQKWQKNNKFDINFKYSSSHCIFSVDKRDILNNSKEFYYNLINEMNYHNNHETVHYLERSWVTLFNPKYTIIDNSNFLQYVGYNSVYIKDLIFYSIK